MKPPTTKPGGPGRSAGCIPCAISLSCALVLLGMAASILFLHHEAVDIEPSPALDPVQQDDGFPFVDWDYWKAVNPDIVGWITIPGTELDYPIVQAPENDPHYYLDHDVFGRWNYMGCPYLDSHCREGGLEGSANAVVFGHNLGYGDTSMFARIADYLDAGFAQSHQVILVQTPRKKMRFQALGALCADGSIPTKRTDFESRNDLATWLSERMGECQTVIRRASPEADRLLTLCTCSYNGLENERTILFAERRSADAYFFSAL